MGDREDKLGELESMSVSERRLNLTSAMGSPQVGRRPKPEPYDPRPRRILYARGIALGMLVVIAVIIIILIIGSQPGMRLG